MKPKNPRPSEALRDFIDHNPEDGKLMRVVEFGATEKELILVAQAHGGSKWKISVRTEELP